MHFSKKRILLCKEVRGYKQNSILMHNCNEDWQSNADKRISYNESNQKSEETALISFLKVLVQHLPL